MSKLIFVFSLLSLISACVGQLQPIIQPGQCDDSITVVTTFDAQQYEGVWYDIESLPSTFPSGTCNTTTYTLTGTGTISVQNTQVSGGVLQVATGTATFAAGVPATTAKLNVIIGTSTGAVPYWVLDTDYTTFALVYSCRNVGTNQRQINSWKLGRNTGPLPVTATNRINTIIAGIPALSSSSGSYIMRSHSAQDCSYFVDLDGACPTTVTGIANFDVTRFLGTWLEVARYPQPTQTGQCNRAVYSAGAAGVVSIVNSQVTNEALVTISGQATVSGTSGALQVTLNDADGPRTQTLHVLATDYDNYALLYSCTNIDGNRRRVGSWQMRKNTNPPTQEATNAINAAIKATQDLREEYYLATSQTDAACFYYPEFTKPPATIELPGPCDTTITGVADFDVNRYLGTWLEVARYPQPTQTGQCNRAVYSAGAAGVVSIVNSQVTNEALVTIPGQATVSGISGALQVILNAADGPRTQTLHVLATDYDNYALLYSCTNIDGNRRRVGSWQMRKNTNPPTQEATNAINAAIKATQDLREEYYLATSQTDAACFYYPEFTKPPATIELPGPCDTTITGVADFDVNRYLGTWLEVARYPQPTQTGQCNRAVYSAGAAGVVSIVNSQVTNEALVTISGQATVSGISGALQVILNAADGPRTQTLHVLATDYDNYALLYSCTNIDGNRRRVGSWQMRKNTNPPTQEATNAINAAIKATQDLREEYYLATSQTDAACFYYPEFTKPPATIELPGPCDTTITGVADFDVNRYLGTWLEVARYPQPTQTGQCNRAVYSAGAAGVVSIVNSQVTNEALVTISGQATVSGISGALQVILNAADGPRTQTLHVLATDYDNYALLYSCTNIDGNRRRVGSWQMRKNTNPPTQEATNAINAAIKATQDLREEYYLATSQTDAACFYYPEFTKPPATIELPGPCDTTITGVADFDVNRYLGTWLEVARYPQPTQTGQCNRAVYSAGAAGVVSIVNSQVTNEALVTISGQATVSSISGALQVILNAADGPRTQTLHVLATDYDNYALLYSCTNIDGNRRRVGSWQMRKNTNPPTQEATNAINAAIKATQDLREEYYLATSQTDAACFYYPEFTKPPATIELPGPCDTTITGVADFDVNRYLGTWLEVARYPQPTQTGQCNRAVYSAGAAGVVSIVNSQVTNEALVTIPGQATVSGISGALQVILNAADGPRTQTLHVLATDYDNYALLYSCTNIDGNRRRVGSWQMRKNTNPPTQEATNAINAAIKATQDLREEYYLATSQTDAACFYYPEFTKPPATIELPGPCDTTITVVADFDVNRYLGTWLEVARYPQPTQTGQCNRAVYSAGAAGVVSIVNTQVNNEALVTISGQATVSGISGALQVILNAADGPRTQTLHVLATDYDNYALLYSCTNIDGNRRRVGSWQMRKNTNPPTQEATNAINAAITATQDLRQEYYLPTSQTDEACWHYPPQTGEHVILPSVCDTNISGVADINLARLVPGC